MITQLVFDTIPHRGKKLIHAGLPVRFLDFAGWTGTHLDRTEMCYIETPEGETLTVPASAVGSGINGPEETISVLACQLDLKYDTLVKACREKRMLARKSGNAWLSTVNAVEYAQAKGKIR